MSLPSFVFSDHEVLTEVPASTRRCGRWALAVGVACAVTGAGVWVGLPPSPLASMVLGGAAVAAAWAWGVARWLDTQRQQALARLWSRALAPLGDEALGALLQRQGLPEEHRRAIEGWVRNYRSHLMPPTSA